MMKTFVIVCAALVGGVHGGNFLGQTHTLGSVSDTTLHWTSTRKSGLSLNQVQAEFAKYVKPAINAMLTQKGNTTMLHEAIQNGLTVVDLQSALAVIQPPPEVLKLLSGTGTVSQTPTPPELDEASVIKAVKKLNSMIMSAQERLDAKTIECKEFKEKNRQTWGQTVTDLSRIGAEMADLKRREFSLNALILNLGGKSEQSVEDKKIVFAAYDAQRKTDAAQMAIHQADLKVTEFMLELSRCKEDVPTLLQTEYYVCKNGTSINSTFSDATFQSSKELLTERTQKLLDFAMIHSSQKGEGLHLASMAIGDGLEDLEDGDEDSAPPEDAIRRALTLVQRQHEPPASSPVDSGKAASRCAGTKPDCAVLHDTFAALWGEIKDLVEELQMKIDADDTAWKTANDGFIQTVATLTQNIGTAQYNLAETQSSNNAATDLQTKKQHEHDELQKVYDETWGECEAVMQSILFTDICGTITVRNQIIQVGFKRDKDTVVDCAFTDWVPSECSVPCDNLLVGGTQLLSREVITPPSEYGHACPVMNMTKKCGQFPCPVHCVLSDWEDYSKCTKECGGGVQSRTRMLSVKPKNGGDSCRELQESQNCNTFSCDRNCALTDWGQYTPCTQACDTGYKERFKAVSLPTRGDGICPLQTDAGRHQRISCNSQPCTGDEQCIAELDVALAIDGSGSLTEAGFAVMKQFASKLVERFRPEAYGKEAVKVGVVLFGNGRLEPSGGYGGVGLVSDAILGQGLSSDMDATKAVIEGLPWDPGFTNLAQGIAKAGILLSTSYRKSSSGVAIVLTDGAPSFKFSTHLAVLKLRQASTLMIVHVKEFPKVENIELLKSWVSAPVDVNYMYIPGKKYLKGAYEAEAKTLVVKSCPLAISPKTIMDINYEQGYMEVKFSEICADPPMRREKIPRLSWCFGDTRFAGKGIDTFAYNAESGDCQIFNTKCEKKEPAEGYILYRLLNDGDKHILEVDAM